MKKIILLLIILASVSFGTIVVFDGHEKMRIDPEVYAEQYSYEFSDFYVDAETTYAMPQYFNYLLNRNKTGFKISNLYDFSTNEYPGIDSYVEDTFQNYLTIWESSVNSANFEMIDYYYYDGNSDSYLTNTEEPLKELIEQKNYGDKYFHYLKMTFDEKGHLSVESSSMNELTINQFISGRTRNNVESYIFQDAFRLYSESLNFRVFDESGSIEAVENNIASSLNTMDDRGELSVSAVDPTIEIDKANTSFKFKELKNIEVYFAYNKELSSARIIHGHWPFPSYYNQETGSITTYYVLVGFILFLLGLILPIKLLKDTPVFKHIVNIKVEVWVLVALFSFYLLSATHSVAVTYLQDTIALSFGGALNFSSIGYTFQFIVLNAYVSYLIFTGFLLGMMIRYILHIGIIKYIVNHSLILIFVRWFKKRLINACTDIEGLFGANVFVRANSMIFSFLGINIVAIIVIWYMARNLSVIYVSFFSIIYSVILLSLIIAIIKKANVNYTKLRNITNQLASGALDVKINDDLGVYNDVKNDLMNIKSSFSKAVFEEVKSQRMKTELISNVSHDLKTPLTNIINYTDLLKNEHLDLDNQREYIATIDRNSKRLKNLIEDLFEVSKLNSGDIELERHRIDVCGLIKQIYLEWEDKYQSKGLEARFVMQPDKIVLNLDSYKSHRIFENLLNNIYKYALDNTRVYIDAKIVANQCIIEFKNISETEINFDSYEATDRFVRGDKSRTTEGSGLGLAIAKSLTELHGGKIEIIVDGDLFKAILVFDLPEEQQLTNQ